MRLIINGETREVDADPRMPLLWAIRDLLGLTGTKFGCGAAQCGACTVLLDGKPIRACATPVEAARGKAVTTIEGVAPEHPVKRAWKEINVPQCGYCQSGQVLAAVALLAEKPKPTDAEIDAAMSGNLCRCGTYPRIRRAIHEAGRG